MSINVTKLLLNRPICTNIHAGLGNNMFQYAAGYAYAKLHNRRLVLHGKTDELTRTFNIKNKIISHPDQRYIFDESDGWNQFRDFMHIDQFTFLNGYFQDPQIFNKYRADLLKIFSFKLPLIGDNATFAQYIQNTNSVSLHVRRTDYLLEFPKSVLTPKYYLSAIEYIASKIQNPHFYIFSDSLRWVAENIKINYPHTFITSNRSLPTASHDMHLLSMCKHHIVANSSFSWWGAWLCQNPNKMILSPETWITDFNKHKRLTQNIIPENWITFPTGN